MDVQELRACEQGMQQNEQCMSEAQRHCALLEDNISQIERIFKAHQAAAAGQNSIGQNVVDVLQAEQALVRCEYNRARYLDILIFWADFTPCGTSSHL